MGASGKSDVGGCVASSSWVVEAFAQKRPPCFFFCIPQYFYICVAVFFILRVILRLECISGFQARVSAGTIVGYEFL